MKDYKKFLFLLFFFTPVTINSAVSPAQLQMLEQLPPDQRASILSKMETQESLMEEIEDAFEEGTSNLIERPENLTNEDICEECIFGYDFFQYSPTTFAPVDNTPVPSDYVLGPGDKLSICLLYTSPSPRDQRGSRLPSSA